MSLFFDFLFDLWYNMPTNWVIYPIGNGVGCMERDFKKEQEKCKRLGALKFKDFVLRLEEKKYSLVKRIFPSIISKYDKFFDFRKKQELKRAKTEQERQLIIKKYQQAKMMVRIQYNNNQNANYHISSLRPTQMYHYAKWNKRIHERGLKKDIAVTLGALGLSFLNPITLVIVPIELLSMFIDFECVNLQNYTISRMEEKKETIERMESRNITKEVQRHGEAAKVIGKAMTQTENIPEPEMVINSITSKEQLEQIKDMLLRTKSKREVMQKEKIKQMGVK